MKGTTQMAKRPTKELYHSPELSLLSQSGHVLQTLAAHILLSLHETSLLQILGHGKSLRPPLDLVPSIRPKLKSTVSLLWDPNSYTAQQTMRNPPGPLPGCPALPSPPPARGQHGPLALTRAALGQEAPGCCPFIGQVEAGLLLL